MQSIVQMEDFEVGTLLGLIGNLAMILFIEGYFHCRVRQYNDLRGTPRGEYCIDGTYHIYPF